MNRMSFYKCKCKNRIVAKAEDAIGEIIWTSTELNSARCTAFLKTFNTTMESYEELGGMLGVKYEWVHCVSCTQHIGYHITHLGKEHPPVWVRGITLIPNDNMTPCSKIQAFEIDFEGFKKAKAVLIFDDKEYNAERTEKVTKRYNWSAVIAGTQDEAFKMIRQTQFDLIIINMDSFGNEEIVKCLRKDGVKAQILGLCGKDDSCAKFKAAGLDYCWKMPMSVDDFQTIDEKIK